MKVLRGRSDKSIDGWWVPNDDKEPHTIEGILIDFSPSGHPKNRMNALVLELTTSCFDVRDYKGGKIAGAMPVVSVVGIPESKRSSESLWPGHAGHKVSVTRTFMENRRQGKAFNIETMVSEATVSTVALREEEVTVEAIDAKYEMLKEWVMRVGSALGCDNLYAPDTATIEDLLEPDGSDGPRRDMRAAARNERFLRDARRSLGVPFKRDDLVVDVAQKLKDLVNGKPS